MTDAHSMDSIDPLYWLVIDRTFMLSFIYLGAVLFKNKSNNLYLVRIYLPILMACIIFTLLPVSYFKARYQLVMLPLLAPYFVYFIQLSVEKITHILNLD